MSGPGSVDRRGFARGFARPFDWQVEWLFAIKCRASAAIPHRRAVCGVAILPTSPRLIEVGS